MTQQENNRNHRYAIDYSTQYFFNKYRKKFKNTNLGVVTSQKEFTKILTTFHSKIIDEMYLNKYIFKPPHGFGSMYLTKRESRIIERPDGSLHKTSPIDIRATKKLWEDDEEAREAKTLVRYQNYHSDGMYFRVFWNHTKSKFKNKRYFALKLYREYNRRLAKYIFEGEADALIQGRFNRDLII